MSDNGLPHDAVTVSFSTNVDLRLDVMTDEMWIDLGKHVAMLAAHTRRLQQVSGEASSIQPE